MESNSRLFNSTNDSVGFYRVEFDDVLQRNYFTGFEKAGNDLYPTIKRIIDSAEEHDIKHIWWFLEPYAEITWFATDEEFLHDVQAILDEKPRAFRRSFQPKDGDFFNWYGLDKDEIEVSARSYAEIRKVSQVFMDHGDKLGLGRECHYQRTLHVLANQMGMNYFDEGWASLKHGVACMMFYWLNPHAAAHVLRKFNINTGLTFKQKS